MTFPSLSRTGKALTRYSVSKVAMSLNVAFPLTATTRVVITSRTLVLMAPSPLLKLFISYSSPRGDARHYRPKSRAGMT